MVGLPTAKIKKRGWPKILVSPSMLDTRNEIRAEAGIYEATTFFG